MQNTSLVWEHCQQVASPHPALAPCCAYPAGQVEETYPIPLPLSLVDAGPQSRSSPTPARVSGNSCVGCWVWLGTVAAPEYPQVALGAPVTFCSQPLTVWVAACLVLHSRTFLLTHLILWHLIESQCSVIVGGQKNPVMYLKIAFLF